MDGAAGVLVEVRELSVAYLRPDGTGVRVVDELDLAVGQGEIVGILGESGSGKSTLAHAILQLLPPNARCKGKVLFNAHDLLAMTDAELGEMRGRRISLVPQDPALSLNPVMTAGAQIAEVLKAHLPSRGRARRERVLELLGEVGFEDAGNIYNAYPHQLSGGQRQRVVIAQAIACNPALVIADEATSKLDAPLRAEITALLARIRRKHGIAILTISHDPALFAGFADRIAVMYAGRIVEIGTTAEIFRTPLHPYTEALVRIAKSATGEFASSRRTRFAAIEGESPNPGAFPGGCRFHPRCAERMEVCAQRYPQAFLTSPSRPVNCFKYGK